MSTEISLLVVVEKRESFAILRLNRPDKRNAMNRAARQQLREALERLNADKVPAVVLTGTGPSFCSGVDLKERERDLADGVREDSRTEWHELNAAIRDHPAIFVAAVNGTAMGGGVTLINVCDLAIAGERASFTFPEIGFGSYAQLSGPSTQFKIAPKRAAWLMLTGEPIDARTALAWGLVNECVADEDLLPRAEALAARIARFDPIALQETKRALDRIPGAIQPWRDAFEYGLSVNARIRERRAQPENPWTGDTST